MFFYDAEIGYVVYSFFSTPSMYIHHHTEAMLQLGKTYPFTKRKLFLWTNIVKKKRKRRIQPSAFYIFFLFCRLYYIWRQSIKWYRVIKLILWNSLIHQKYLCKREKCFIVIKCSTIFSNFLVYWKILNMFLRVITPYYGGKIIDELLVDCANLTANRGSYSDCR